MSVNNGPWCVVHKSLCYPPIELHGHHGSVGRVVKCVMLVTDYMGRVKSMSKSWHRELATLPASILGAIAGWSVVASSFILYFIFAPQGYWTGR
jgi:tetrahydromethanopterin S-methyltransferase subunit E